MGRVSDEELERLKRDVAVARLVEARVVDLKKQGADLIGLCPFHADVNPSLVVTPSKNLWHCLGACQTGGSVIDWVMKAEGVSFRHAVELLRTEAALAPTVFSQEPPPKKSTARKLTPLVAADADDQAALSQVMGYYQETLKESPEALAYLESRGLKSAEMIERFKLGFANRTIGYRLPSIQTVAGKAIRGRLQTLGVLRESGHEHFWGSVVIPLFDEVGAVVGMYGRKITPNLPASSARHMYLPGQHRGVFNVEAFGADKTIILCEALIDALTFWVNGHRNVTAAYGVEGFTGELLEAFRKHETKTCFIAFDRDEAGDKGAEKVAGQLTAAGVACYRVQFPRGMDANEYATKMKPAEKALDLVLRSAAWMGGAPSAGREVAPPAAPQAKVAAASTVTNVTGTALLPATAREPGRTREPAPVPTALAREPAPAPVGPESAREPARVLAREPASVLAPARETPSPAPPPSMPPPPAPTTVSADEAAYVFGDRRYRVRGLLRNTSVDALKVNILAGRGDVFHVDNLDLYSARARTSFIKQAAGELGVEEEVIKTDVGRLLLSLEELQAVKVKEAATPATAVPAVGESEREAALAFLRDPRLLERIVEDFRRCGVVGEETNKLVAYLAGISRKLDEPLAIVVQSSSAAGKSSLMDAVLAFVPEEERVKYAAMTGQSLFYMGETSLRHKVLAIVEEEGASRASYALKILQSEGELTIASTGKDPQTGKLVTQEYHVEGPVMIFLTTTAVDIDEELLNRCLVLTVDEERGQTEAIHELQRFGRDLDGRIAKRERAAVLGLHRNAQRLLEPLMVVNPYARRLTFPSHRTRTRRDHTKYLTLIDVVTLLHQHQRVRKEAEVGGETVAYIEATLEDIVVANRIAHQVLGRSLDELAPQTRRLLTMLDAFVRGECERQAISRKSFRFTRREAREATGLGETQVRLHLDRLVELEYVAIHRGDNGQSFVYELLYEGSGDSATPFLPGLVDVEALRTMITSRGETPTSRGEEATSRGPRGPVSGGARPGRGEVPEGENPEEKAAEHASAANGAENAHLAAGNGVSQYVHEVTPC